MRLLILYEELAPYFFSNIQYFVEHYQIPVLIVSKNINPVAPFQFNTQSEYIKIINRDSLCFDKLLNEIKSFQPSCLIQAGWIYKPYFEITRLLSLHKNILLLDNQWENTFRQNIGSIYFKWKYKHLFQKAFVPGNKQKAFAKHLGFKEKDIEVGFYCCDTKMFEDIYSERKKRKHRNFSFLYTGRYAPEKNIELLWDVFTEVCEDRPNTWKLLCAGKGNIPARKHPRITHLGFLQPQEFTEILLKTDVFVLPSIFEPWGVVVHEIVTAGIPVISSSKVGANEFFVKHQKNGFIFSPGNKSQLKEYLIQMINLNDDEYFKMCDTSYELSKNINTNDWIKKFYHLCSV